MNQGQSLAAGALLSVALVMPAVADTQPPDAAALGMTEGILKYCSRLDPKAADRYDQRAKVLVQGVAEPKLQQLRGSDDYRQAFDSVAEMTAKLSESDALKACTDSLAEGR